MASPRDAENRGTRLKSTGFSIVPRGKERKPLSLVHFCQVILESRLRTTLMITLERVAEVAREYHAGLASTPSIRGLTPENIAKGPAAARRVKRAKAVAAYAGIARVMCELRREGMTFAAIAERLNEE